MDSSSKIFFSLWRKTIKKPVDKLLQSILAENYDFLKQFLSRYPRAGAGGHEANIRAGGKTVHVVLNICPEAGFKKRLGRAK